MRSPALAALALATACAHATDAPYRLPYADGVEVEITADHVTHSTPDEKMFDFRASDPDQVLVAAAPGWVRFIKDSGDSSASTNNYVWIEHPGDWCQPVGGVTTGPARPGGCRACPRGPGKCNEWTLYAHMARDSVRGWAGLTENEWVVAGQPIGIEGDVGFTPGGRHVHFTIFEIDLDHPDAAGLPTVNGDYEAYADAAGRTERVPLFCTAAGLRYPRQGDVHVAAGCP